MATQEQVEQARTGAQTAAQTASDFATSQPNLEQEFKQTLQSKLANESGLVEAKAEAQSDYLASPSEARAQYGSQANESFIFDPYQRDAIINRYIANARVPWQVYTDKYAAEMGSIPEMVQPVVNAYGAESQRLANQAQLARQAYQDLLGEFESNRTYDLQLAQFNAAQAERAREAASSSGITSLLTGIMGGSPEDQAAALEMAVLSGELSPSAANYIAKSRGIDPKTMSAGKDAELAINSLNAVKDKIDQSLASGGFMGILNSPDARDSYATAKQLAGQELARLYEKGVLTDKDRDFYQDMLSNRFMADIRPERAKQRIDEIIAMVKNRISANTNEPEPLESIYNF